MFLTLYFLGKNLVEYNLEKLQKSKQQNPIIFRIIITAQIVQL